MKLSSDEVLVQDDFDAATSGGSVPVSGLRGLRGYAIFCYFSGLGTGAAGTLMVQVSGNGVDWSDVSSLSPAPYTDTTPVISFETIYPAHPYVRIYNNATTPNGGTITITIVRNQLGI